MNRSELKAMLDNPATNPLAKEVLRQQVKGKKPKPAAGIYKSGWESEFASILATRQQQGRIVAWGYEQIRLRIGTSSDRKGSHSPMFTPDFHVVLPDGRLRFFEVKGFYRAAAKVRSGVAAGLFPYFVFVVVAKQKGSGWRVIETFNGGQDGSGDGDTYII